MTRNEQLEMVVRLACLTEHRTDQEQRALLAIAWRCDMENNRQTVTNRARRRPGWEPQDLVSVVDATRVLEDGQRDVPVPKGWVETWERWARDEHLWAHAGMVRP